MKPIFIKIIDLQQRSVTINSHYILTLFEGDTDTSITLTNGEVIRTRSKIEEIIKLISESK
jgi:uncharacterized protein YlzI (FlbEa/FlbD family)